MKNIVSLLLKDIYIQEYKGYIILLLPITFFYFLLNSMVPLANQSLLVILTTYFLIIMVNQNETNKLNHLFLNSLPTTRAEIVLAKYVSVIVWFTIAVFLCNVFTFALHFTTTDTTYSIISINELLFAFGVILILASIYYP
ncbi:ABC-2 transporter permease, partial [Caldalkalibacillus mannanilyticus]|uniref:ABC-2 transporter permease n=1 Tax=Caldalkalibacillus mannanilyticus TaxID=1418 RepID=UPI0004687AFC